MKNSMSVSTDYGVLRIFDGGRRIEYQLHDSVKASVHHRDLMGYVNRLWDDGVDKINADHLSMDFFDRRINLNRGKRKLDLVYYREGRMFECELKTSRECGLDKTYVQVKEQAMYCQRLILLVPQKDREWVNDQLRLRKIDNVTVDHYD